MAKKEKKQKSKVSSLLLLLLLSIVMLVTTTYAWFTANTKVSISDINIQVEATGGLQISTDAVNWKTMVSNDDIKTGAYLGNKNQLPTVLQPVSSGLVLEGGKIKMFLGTVTADDSGDFKLTTNSNVEEQGTTGNFVAFDVFLKSTTQVDVYLDSGSGVTNTVPEEGSASDKGLQSAARIAFINEGTDENGSSNAALSLTTTNQNDVYLWEPNIEKHHNNGIENYKSIYQTTIVDDSEPIATYGVKSAVSNILLIDAYKGINAMAGSVVELKEPALKDNVNAKDFVGGQVSNGTTSVFNTENDNIKKKLFPQMLAGITKIRIYMWIEGQDVDCNNEASGSNLTFRVKLSVPSAPVA